MDSDTLREGGRGPDDPGTIWRRRVLALGGVLVLVALFAWACSGANGDEDPAAQASPTPTPSPTRSVRPTVTVTVTAAAPGAAASANPSGPAPDGSTPAPSASAKPEHHRPGDPCAPGDVVLTMWPDDTTYRSGDLPRFTYTAVNTGRRTCTFDVGAKALRLVVRSGHDRVWSNADCTHAAHRRQKLARGVPVHRTVTWHRKRSFPDCRGHHPAARTGTYAVSLHSPHRHRHHTHVFHLR